MVNKNYKFDASLHQTMKNEKVWKIMINNFNVLMSIAQIKMKEKKLTHNHQSSVNTNFMFTDHC